MEVESDDVYLAGRLIQWGLSPRAVPLQEPEYQTLIEQYLDAGAFRALVRDLARGLGLMVLDAGPHGIVLAPTIDSVFELRGANFRPTASGADDRLLDGLAQLAIAASVFPRAQDLDEESTVARPPVTVDEVDDTLRILCDRIGETHKREPDPVAADETAGLYEAWRVYRRRVSVMETRDDRRASRTTRRIIEYGLERLREAGCFVREERGGEARFQPTWRYQVLVKEFAATAVFERIRDILDGASVADGVGGAS